ncbi:MAG: HAD-IA family hydrolase [Acidimicrobiales bacterium]
MLAMFDVVLESRELGIRKPAARLYQLACERLDVSPTEVVYLDDLGVNLESARALGMATIKVVDPARAIEELCAVVGEPIR